MLRLDPEDRDVRRQAGFAMPLCLIAIALLALSAATLLSQLNAATARAQFSQDQVEKEWSQYMLEQQVVWRTLIEVAARRTANDFQNESETMRNLRLSTGPWNGVSEDLSWNGVHGNSDLEQGRFTVRVQDARGLLDLNYLNADYLNFLAKVLGMPAGARRPAVDELIERISSFRTVAIEGEEAFRLKSITGIERREEFCGLKRWSEIRPCRDSTSLFRYATFGNGVLPNINLTPSYLRSEMGVDDRNATPVSARMSWINIQRSEGFYDAMQSTNASGFRYHIWITDKQFDSINFFVLTLERDRLGRPFSVSNRINEISSPTTSD